MITTIIKRLRQSCDALMDGEQWADVELVAHQDIKGYGLHIVTTRHIYNTTTVLIVTKDEKKLFKVYMAKNLPADASDRRLNMLMRQGIQTMTSELMNKEPSAKVVRYQRELINLLEIITPNYKPVRTVTATEDDDEDTLPDAYKINRNGGD